MKRIEIQGIISPAEFDLFGLGDTGVFATPGPFLKALRDAEKKGEDVEVWINSPGGDVDVGNEMLAAFQSFKGYKCVTVGGLAASMAANFVLQCGCRVEVHENSRLMFHSASSLTWGGAGALRDTAEAIDKINAPMIARLKELGVPAEKVDEGFSEGREFWLSAEEAVQYGIAAKIVKGAAPARSAAFAACAAFQKFSRLAAEAKLEHENPDRKMEQKDQNDPAPAPAPADPAPADPAPADPAPADPAPADPAPADPAPADPAPADPAPADPAPADPAPADPAPAPADPDKADAIIAKIQSAASKKINAIKAECAKRLEAKDAELAALRKEHDNLTKKLEACAEDLASAKAAHDKLVSNVLTGGDAEPKSWRQAVKDLGLEAALAKYPDLAAQYRAAYGRRQG